MVSHRLEQEDSDSDTRYDVWSEFTPDQWLPRSEQVINKETGMVDYAIDRVASNMVREVCLQATNNHSLVIMAEDEVVKALVGDFAMCRGVMAYKGDPFRRTITETQNSLYAEAQSEISVAMCKWCMSQVSETDVPEYLTIIPYIPWPQVGRGIVNRDLLGDLTVPHLWVQLKELRESASGRYETVYLSLEGGIAWSLSINRYSEYGNYRNKIDIDFQEDDLTIIAEKLAGGLERDGD